MPLHHPNENLLVEFAAGTLPVAQAVAVKAHLHFCADCQQSIHKMETLAGTMLESLEPQSTAPDSFDKLMSSIDAISIDKQETTEIALQKPNNNSAYKHNGKSSNSKPSQINGHLPKLVLKLMEQKPLKWKKTNRSLQTAPLTVGQKQYEVSLQRIEAGETAPEHDHRGTEITVVLEGSFSDQQGIYQQGDFLIKEPGDIHQPISARNQYCLCLAVQEAPVKLTSLWGKLLNPFIRIHAA